MQCLNKIEVRSDWISMKSNEYDVVELSWYQLEARVGFAPCDGFLNS
jgi:hypothetical protein